MKYTVYRFAPDNYLYCAVKRHDEKYIKGEVINGVWKFIFDIAAGKIYAATRLSDLNEKNFICDTTLLDEVVYNKGLYREWLASTGQTPDYFGNYNGVIEWAKSVLTESEK